MSQRRGSSVSCIARQSTDDGDVNDDDDDDISANVCSLYFMQAPKINPG